MANLPYRVIPEGLVDGKLIPVNVVFLDLKDLQKENISQDEAIFLAAREFDGPTAINVFDMDAVTTTSDGILTEGAVVRMGASDRGLINPDFGILPMAEIPYSDEIALKEPHLLQWKKLCPGRRLYRGPDPAKKIIPVHNVVISGRAANNNSATEMMNILTMEELIFPILGQLECMTDGDLLVGYTGEHISVGIGMTVAEQYGRVFPHPQFSAGNTAHGCGAYAKTLKKDIPCIVSGKKVLAARVIRAFECGCVPARQLGCSPAVLSIARAMGSEIHFAGISPAAQAELDSLGLTREWMQESYGLSAKEVLARADEILPGVEEGIPHKASELVEKRTLRL